MNNSKYKTAKIVLNTAIVLQRACKATLIPLGHDLLLKEAEVVVVTQALGGSYTVRTMNGQLARIDARDSDALGFASEPAPEQPQAAGPLDRQRVIDTLKTVFDPEIPVNVVDLGLVYVCEVHPLAGGGHQVEIKMSMTAPGCGMGDVLKGDAQTKVAALDGVTDVDIEIVWEPPWDASRMSEAAQLQLGML